MKSQKRKTNLRKNADALTTFLFELMPGYENYMVRVGCQYKGTSGCCGSQPQSE